MDDLILFQTNYPREIERRTVKVLTSIRNIINRGFFSTFYSKRDLLQDVHNMMDDNIVEVRRKFSFLQESAREGYSMEKDEVYKAMKHANLSNVIEFCIESAVVFNMLTIKNYTSHYDGFLLLEMADKIVESVLSFKSSSVIDVHASEVTLREFVVFVVREIASANVNIYIDENGGLVHLLVQLLLKYMQIPFVQPAILQELTTALTNFASYYKRKNAPRIDGFQSEIFSALLNVLLDVLKANGMNELVNAFENIEGSKKSYIDDLLAALNSARGLFPDYLECYINHALDFISRTN